MKTPRNQSQIKKDFINIDDLEEKARVSSRLSKNNTKGNKRQAKNVKIIVILVKIAAQR